MNKQQLATKIWESANKMRSKIEANEYKDYILGFIFYKYLSDKELKFLKDNDFTDKDEIECPKCHNIIELDWDDECCDGECECCGSQCSHDEEKISDNSVAENSSEYKLDKSSNKDNNSKENNSDNKSKENNEKKPNDNKNEDDM
jgi:type I restriction-modification system DNA methylase subunit